jgi:predicted nucleotidyltransferase
VDPKERLPAEWPDLDIRAMLRSLVEAGVEFVVIGGVALWLHGYPRVTRDLDIVFAQDETNLEMLGRVLVELKAQLRGVDDHVPFVADGQTLRGIELLTLTTSVGWLDVHRLPRGVSGYERLRRNAEHVDLGGFSVLVASPDDLIAMKEAAGRPQDQIDVAALEAIKRLRKQLDRR